SAPTGLPGSQRPDQGVVAGIVAPRLPCVREDDRPPPALRITAALLRIPAVPGARPPGDLRGRGIHPRLHRTGPADLVERVALPLDLHDASSRYSQAAHTSRL